MRNAFGAGRICESQLSAPKASFCAKRVEMRGFGTKPKLALEREGWLCAGKPGPSPPHAGLRVWP
ncbi:MAG: hypothetical protein ABJ246_11210 [Paracoccaceae bacterium]